MGKEQELRPPESEPTALSHVMELGVMYANYSYDGSPITLDRLEWLSRWHPDEEMRLMAGDLWQRRGGDNLRAYLAARRSSSDEAEVVATGDSPIDFAFWAIEAAFIRGVLWWQENGSDTALTHKAARDHADYATRPESELARSIASPPPSVATGGVTEERIDAGAEAMWRHEVHDIPAGKRARDKMQFTDLRDDQQADYRSFATAVITAALAVGDEGMGEALRSAVGMCEQYAQFIRRVPAVDIEQHPYLPELEQVIEVGRLALREREAE